MAKNKRKRKHRAGRRQLQAKRGILLVCLAAFFLVAVLLIRRGIALRRSEGTASEEEEASSIDENLRVFLGDQEFTDFIERDDGLYVRLARINEYYLNEELFIDLANEKIYRTTLKEGKQATSMADIPIYIQEGAVYIQLDWAAQAYDFEVSRVGQKRVLLMEKQYTEEAEIELPTQLPDAPISLVWYQDFYGTYDEDSLTTVAASAGTANVLSPTWFSLQEDGTLASLANEEWVTWAHENGMQVWALIDNDFSDTLTLEVLQDEAKRETLITEIVRQCQTFHLDGVNIDFEALSGTSAGYFVEFIRELGAVLRPDGYVVSVDVSVPQDWSYYYRRDLLARACDYIIVMAYDEHYSGSEAGSVSSMGFTEGAIRDMLEMTTRDKLILGIPFYTRCWTVNSEGTYAESWSMKATDAYIEEWALEPVYDEATGQDFVSQEDGDTVYKIWIENAMSVRKRLLMAAESDLAGVAAWKIGMESADVWPLMAEYRNGGLLSAGNE